MALVYLTRPTLRDAVVKPDEEEEESEEDDAWPGVDGRSSEGVSDDDDEPAASIAMEVSEKAD